MSNVPKEFRPQDKQHHTYYCRYKDPKGALNLSGKNEHEFYTESLADWVDFLGRIPPDNILPPDKTVSAPKTATPSIPPPAPWGSPKIGG